MGIARVEVIDGALYGFKGEIKQTLREGHVPDWMHSTGRGPDSSEEALEKAKERAKSQEFSTSAFFEVYGRQPTRGRRSFSSTDSKTRPPERIREKLEAYLDGEHQNVLDWLREGEFYRGLFVYVYLGPQGGIKDIKVKAKYGN